MSTDLITVGLSEDVNDKLDSLKELGHFAEKMDGYRLAVSLAIAHGIAPPEISKRTTLFNVGSLDPDQHLRQAVEILMPEFTSETTPYRAIERLAEWGVLEIFAEVQNSGRIDFSKILAGRDSEG